jgi:hypothetical protein
MSYLKKTFNEVYSFFLPSIRNDPEMLYVIGLMAYLFSYNLGKTQEWDKISDDYRERYRSFWPDGPDPTIFDNQGAYGVYFGGQARVKNGY